MTVPSKEQFESFFDLAKWNIPKERNEATYSILLDEVEPFLLEIIKERVIIRAALLAHPVGEWFWGQQNIKHAYQFIRGPHMNNITPLPSPENAKNIAKRILAGVTPELLDAKPDLFADWRLFLRMEIEQHPAPFFLALITAFFNYHHTDRWLKVTNIGRNSSDTMAEYLRAIQRLQEAVADAEILDEFHHGMKRSGLFSAGFNSGLDRQKNKVMRCIADNSLLLPTCRADEKSRERVLVYDLVKAFQNVYRKPKSRAITAMLMTEGVINPLDQRTVERLIKEWKTRKQEIDTVIHESKEWKEMQASLEEYRQLRVPK